jgi:hypothetical protein
MSPLDGIDRLVEVDDVAAAGAFHRGGPFTDDLEQTPIIYFPDQHTHF